MPTFLIRKSIKHSIVFHSNMYRYYLSTIGHSQLQKKKKNIIFNLYFNLLYMHYRDAL